MARALRIEFEDAVYHLCTRGNERQKIFRDDADRARFLELLERSAARYQVSVLALVLMANHFHLIAQTHRGNLSRWMHWLMVSYTVYFNWRHHRSGHLFQGRYKSFLVQNEAGDYLLTLSRYIHLNPVRGKRLGEGTPGERRERLRRYRWSSYPGYAGLRKQIGFVEEGPVLRQMGARRENRRIWYRRFVEEGLLREMQSPWELVQWQTVLGNESFVRRVRDRLRAKDGEREEVTAVRQGVRPTGAKEIIKKVAKSYGLSQERVQQTEGGYGLKARTVAMWLVWENCAMSLREVGEIFGGLNYAAVAQRFRRLSAKDKARGAKILKS